MRAIAVEHWGGRPRYLEIPVPAPGVGEVEVALVAASVNPLDRHVESGFLERMGRGSYRFPLVVGFDGAGVVSRVGSRVTGFRAGDRIFGQFWSDPLQFGTYAETTIVQAEPTFGALQLIPDGVGFAEAAAAPTAGMMALGALESSGAGAGDTLVILGAAGGVGTLLVQCAAAQRVRVVASAADNAASDLRVLGARVVVPRDRTLLADALAGIGAVDAVIDLTGDRDTVELAVDALRPGGRLVSIAFGIPDAARTAPGIAAIDYSLDRKATRLAELARLLASGALHPVVGTEIAFDDALPEKLWSSAGAGLRGKTVLRIRDDPGAAPA